MKNQNLFPNEKKKYSDFNFNSKPLAKPQRKTFGDHDYGIPTEKVCVAVESRDLYAFCASGNT
jgi:hypothetical protein